MSAIFAARTNPLRCTLLLVLLVLNLSLMIFLSTGQAQAACLNRVTSVSAFNTSNHQTVYISGQCFGVNRAYNNLDSYHFRITVYPGGVATPWNACYVGDYVSCSISYWGNNLITFKGFSGAYGRPPFVLFYGEQLAIQEINPQNPQRWDTCTVYVGRTSSCAEF